MKKIIILFINLSLLNNLYSQSGILDTTFGINGKTQKRSGLNNQVYDSALQNDGKIIVVGNTNSYRLGSSFLVTRYLENGDLDTTFGNSGYVKTLVGDYCTAQSISLQKDGKIVVAGTAYGQSEDVRGADIMVVRYNIDGSLDLTFGTGGITTLSLNRTQVINSLLIQKNGNIIVGGLFSLQTNLNQDTFGLARFTPNGTLDTTFGENGYVYTPNIYRGQILDMKFIDNEDIIAVGESFIINNYLMVRYNSNGQVINSFGSNNNGIVEVSFNEIAVLNKCVIDKNNNIYALGSTYDNIKYNAFITKYNSNGIKDITFGTNGTILKDFKKSSFGVDFSIDNNNNLIVGYSVGPTNDYDFGLESYDLSGNLNLSFGTNGFFTTKFIVGHEYFRTMLIQPDNKIIIAGHARNQLLARVNNDISLSSNSFENKNIQVSVTPNPFTDIDNVLVNIEGTGKINISLFDLNGRLISKLVKDKELYGNSSNIEKLNLSKFNLSKGIYILKLNLNNQFFKEVKIIKN
jgi:uncharacterized delta-60 repeat protein